MTTRLLLGLLTCPLYSQSVMRMIRVWYLIIIRVWIELWLTWVVQQEPRRRRVWTDDADGDSDPTPLSSTLCRQQRTDHTVDNNYATQHADHPARRDDTPPRARGPSILRPRHGRSTLSLQQVLNNGLPKHRKSLQINGKSTVDPRNSLC